MSKAIPDLTGEHAAIPDKAVSVEGVDFVLTQGDTADPLIVTPRDSSGAIIQIPTGSTVTFAMKARAVGATSLTVNNAAGSLVAATDPATGTSYNKLRYSFQAADSAQPGAYYGQFTVTLAGGAGVEFIPSPNPLIILVAPKVQ